MIRRSIQYASLSALCGLVPHYLAFYTRGTRLWTETIAEWIMARTPSHYAVALLQTMGEWAKPFAMTGGLAALGFALWIPCVLALTFRKRGARVGVVLILGVALAEGMRNAFYLTGLWGHWSFWIPALLTAAICCVWSPPVLGQTVALASRRSFVRQGIAVAAPLVMSSGTVAVAVESYARNRILAGRAVQPVPLYDFHTPPDRFALGLVRPLVTPVLPLDQDGGFYYMSKNPVDPNVDPRDWHLDIKIDNVVVRSYSYQQLLSLPRREEYVTLRCVSNSLTTNLMSNAHWSGIHLEQLIDPAMIPAQVVEAAVIGLDGHSDSFPWRYAFRPEVLLALGMNGKTLNRDHGFPVRLLAPRYYGFKHIKWLKEINFTSQPYFGYWPRELNFTKEPAVHTMSMIDKMMIKQDKLVVAGVSFAGDRGIRAVEVRSAEGPWRKATMETALSSLTWTRWYATFPAVASAVVEARAMDGTGQWQATVETPLIPNGVQGPTRRRFPS